MTYEQAVEYIHSLLRFGIKPGLSRTRKLLALLGNPEADLQFVHIAGTNGKGTTSTMLSNILQCAGYKTGLFTSPYVFDFRERMQVNGQKIGKDDLASVTARVKTAADKMTAEGECPTEFEAVTAAALLYFKEQNCDYVVLEVGLGGRFDSTNVIKSPKVSVITSVSLDHMGVLGDTVEQIATEKCGIIKSGCPCVTTDAQDKTALSVIRRTAAEQESALHIGSIKEAEILAQDLCSTDIFYHGMQIHIPLAGAHQVENTVGVITAAEALELPQSAIRSGIERTRMRGRMEIIGENPTVLIDGGHNAECGEALAALLQKFGGKIHAVLGMMADKDCEAYLQAVLPHCTRVTAVTPSNPRAMDCSEMQKLCKKYCAQAEAIHDPKAAYQNAVQNVEDGETVLVCGSFYMLSDIFGEEA